MKYFHLVLGLLLATGVSAQKLHCGTDELLHRELRANPALRQVYEQNKNLPEAVEGQRSGDRELIYIPVVFHIIHNGDPVGVSENISDAQVISQIDALNRDFSGENADAVNIPSVFTALQAKSNIRFCLAKFDPNGNPTNGIDRQDLGAAGWDESDIEGTVKPSTIWDRSRYLNVWSVNMSGSLIDDGVLAYARFPFMATSANDGVVARFNTIGTTGTLMSSYRLGRTVVHEVGHWLNLFHTWGDDNGSCNGSDNVSDTPNQADLYFGCPTFPQVSCSSNDMFMNYMDYTDDDCRNMFTNGQNSRMINTLGSSRSGLRNAASNCFYNTDAQLVEIIHPKGNACSGTVTPLLRVKNAGIVSMNSLTFGVSVDNAPQTSDAWTGLITTQDETYIQLSPITVSQGQHSIQVTITSINGNAVDDNSSNNSALANFTAILTSFANQVPFVNDFEDGIFPPYNWENLNPNNDITWTMENGISANGVGNHCLSMDNFTSAVNTRGRNDIMITDEYSLFGKGGASLTFDLAYAARSDARTDSLKVDYSLDCGSTWNNIYVKPGSAIATAAFSSSAFIPTNSQWRNEVVDISFLSNQPTVKFRFTNASGWGNKLYLDNINLTATPLSVLSLQGPAFQVFPNPASGRVVIRMDSPKSYEKIQVFNLMGELVFASSVQSEVQSLDLSDLPNGVYVLRLSSSAFTRTTSLEILK